jgi:5-methylcytosine-specific restriction endonuclease McrA
MEHKPKDDVGSTWHSSARGERAWNEDMDRVASRNADARKTGRKEREEQERERAEARRSAEAKRHARLLGGS